MATAAEKEAEAASIAFQLILTQMGLEAVEEAAGLWAEVPPIRTATSGTDWLSKALKLVLNRNRMARDISFAYYRLVRALRTGETIRTPDHPKPKATLSELREDFESLVEDFAPPGYSYDSPSAGGDKSIKAVVIRGFDPEWVKAEEAGVMDEAEIVLKALGTEGMARRIDKTMKDDEPVSMADKKRAKAHAESGVRQAAAVERMAKNGARGTLHEVGKVDRKVVGFVRMSRTGTPCGFCAMLIARGVTKNGTPILYKSGATAGDTDYNGDEYHDNCNCYAEPVFSTQDYKTSERFALNREYAALWPKVTKGYYGKDALSEWRRYFRELASQEDEKNPSPAQEVGAA